MKVTPYQMESLTSFVHRAAAVQSKDLRSYLRELFPSEDYRQKVSFPEDLDALEEGAFMAALNGALDGQKRRLLLLTLHGAQPGVHAKWLRRAGGNNTLGDRFGKTPIYAWCPRCLLGDKLAGRDQFLRLSWRLVTRTFCWTHRRPLTTHCLACNDREANTAFVFDGCNIVLSCGGCGSSYASQLGLPDMSVATALEVARNHSVQRAWNAAIQLEIALERSLSHRSKRKNKGEFQDFVVAFANVLMRRRGRPRAPIDLFVSAAYPAQPNPPNIAEMERPYRASSIAVRRKTHGLMVTLIKNRANLFAIKGLRQGQWGREPTFQELRADLEPEQNADLDRLLLRFAAKWF